jgi:hypothetical protein
MNELASTPLFWLASGLSVIVMAFLLHEVVWLIRGYASANWPTVEGTVVRSDIERFEHAPRDYGTQQSGLHLHVSYEYTVHGKTYQSDLLDCGRSTKRTVVPRSLVNPADAADSWHAQGGRVDVYHDPRNPSVAILEPGVQAVTVRRIVAIVFAYAVALTVGALSLSLS